MTFHRREDPVLFNDDSVINQINWVNMGYRKSYALRWVGDSLLIVYWARCCNTYSKILKSVVNDDDINNGAAMDMQEVDAVDVELIKRILLVHAMVMMRLVPHRDWTSPGIKHRAIYFNLVDQILPNPAPEYINDANPSVVILNIIASARKAKTPGDEELIFKTLAHHLNMNADSEFLSYQRHR